MEACVGGVGGNVNVATYDYKELQLLARLMCASIAVSARANRYVLTRAGTRGGWGQEVSGRGEAQR
jgi:hypothetical protein